MKKLFPKKLVKKYHAKELLFKLEWMKRKYNCVILVTEKEGLSIKPFFKTDEEKEIFTTERAEYLGCSFEQSAKTMAKPTYCLARMEPDNDNEEAELKYLLATGDFIVNDVFGDQPIYPFS